MLSRSIATFLAAAALSLATPSGMVAQGPPALIGGPPSNPAASARAQRAHQARKAKLHLEALDSPSLRLNLFENADRIAVRTSFERVAADRAIWHGRTEDGGTVAFAVVSGAVSGAVFLDGRTFEITPESDGDHAIVELNPAAFPVEDAPMDGMDVQGDGSEAVSTSAVAPDGSTQMDVMVLWTPAARQAVGGTTAAIESVVLAAVSNANLAYANSGVNARLNLVHSGEIPFNEGGIQGDLSALASSGDGTLDAVHSLRQQHGADIVTLLGSSYTSSGSCGIGYIMQSASVAFAPYAFNIVDQTCAVGNLTFAHEVGHNQGLQHDPGNAAASPSYPYAYGFQDPGNAFRTVMSYGGAPRVAHFSSPGVLLNGRTTGTTVQDNARALRNNAAVVAGFKSSTSGSTPACSYSVSPGSLSFSSGTATATVTVTTTSGCSWTSSSGSAWATVSGSGSGSGTATLSIAANTASSRSTVVTVAGRSVSVAQAGATAACAYTVSPTALAFGAAAGSATVSVSTASGCAWTVSGSSWATATGGGTGPGNAVVSVSSNGGASRMTSVNVAGQTVTVTQAAIAASSCTYSVTPTSLSFTSNGGSAMVQVTANAGCAWTTSGSGPWMKVSGEGSGSGAATVTVSSTNGSARNGTVTVAGKSVAVTQAAAPKGGKKR
jgi:hypothetical protein